MDICFDKNLLLDYQSSVDNEWIETNGLGGWAGSSITGTNTCRYHGLMVAALNPPVGRVVLLSKLAETIMTSNGNFELDSNNFNGVIHPQGYKFLEKYTQDLYPCFEYVAGDVHLKRSIQMVYGQNTTIIKYEVLNSPDEFTLKLKPFVAFRDYHWLSKKNDAIRWAYNFNKGTLKISPYIGMPDLYMHVPGSDFHYSPDWYFNFMFKREQERGMDYKEDLFTYGEFLVELKKGDVIYFTASLNDKLTDTPEKLFDAQTHRKRELLKNTNTENLLEKYLTLAADTFIVQRGKDLKTIIAGYHWFADWGRDTMIALPGLCLSTQRYDDAKKILIAFANAVDEGMIPNRFPDAGEVPEYNTADGTLWFFNAIYQYALASNDYDFIKNDLYPVLLDIVQWHIKGTRYQIHEDNDGLLWAGNHTTQLTWMDAKVGDWVVTSRHGKPVEINALWYNALKIMEHFAQHFDYEDDQKKFKQKSTHTAKSFVAQFIKPSGTLYDVLAGDSKDDSIRPNQIFAVSLPFSMLNKSVSKSVVKEVEQHLLTTRGLRSLSSTSQAYAGRYTGDQLSRDAAYHQGTVWSWPLGAFLEAKIKVEGDAAIPKVKKILSQFETHLMEAGLGTVSEIFDGDYPHDPKGCVSQAWGVAEPLRVVKKYLVSK